MNENQIFEVFGEYIKYICKIYFFVNLFLAKEGLFV